MALDFPTSPALNQTYTFGSYTWRWDGTSWVGAVPIVNATINNTTIGAVTPSTGAFTSLTSTSGAFNGSVGATTPSTVAATTLAASDRFTSSTSNTFPIVANGATTGNSGFAIQNTGGTLYSGVESSTGGAIFSGATAYSGVLGTNSATSLHFATNGAVRGTFTSTGLNSTAIGATTPSTGKFTTLQSSSTIVSKISSGVLTYKDSVSPSVGLVEYYRINDGATLSGLIGTRDQVFGGTISDFAIDARSGNLVLGCGGSIVGTFTSTGLNSTAIGATTRSTVAATTISTTGTVTATADNIKAFVGTTGAGTGFAYGTYETNGGAQYGRVGIEGSVGGNLMIGTSAYDFIVGGISGNTWIGAGGTGIAKVSGTGLAVTGALSSTTGANFATSSGSVGIGTASPAYKLQVAGTVGEVAEFTSSATGTAVRINNTNAAGWGSNISFNTNGTAAGFLGSIGSLLGSTAQDLAIYATAGNGFRVYTNGNNERLRVESSGNVGIGTSSPASQLSVSTTTNNLLTLTKTATVALSVTAASSPTGIDISANGGNVLTFNTGSNNGNVGIGTTSPAQRLHVNSSSATVTPITTTSVTGDTAYQAILVTKFDNDSTTSQNFIQFQINNGGANCGKITANGANTAAFGSTSDRRVKENIADLPSQLANIMALRPVEFDYVESLGGGHQIGFVAQEMQQVYPDVIAEDSSEEKILSITGWSKTEARLVKALQELNANLVAQVAALSQRLAALENS